MSLSRRDFLTNLLAGTATLAAPSPALAAPAPTSPDLDIFDITAPGDKTLGERFTLLLPKHLTNHQRVPLLVLLHGLGETTDQRTGAYAWIERYGLLTAYQRLRRPPITRTTKHTYLTEARLSHLNTSLTNHPFPGLAIACPFTPNIAKTRNPTTALDTYARWLTQTVIPRAQHEAPKHIDPAHTHLGGCSLGGYVGLEVLLREPGAFSAFSGVQSAFGLHRAPQYAERLSATLSPLAKPPALLLETSAQDPFHDANRALSKRLTQKGISHELLVLPGPHDQPWLREAGTLEMLHWHTRPPLRTFHHP